MSQEVIFLIVFCSILNVFLQGIALSLFMRVIKQLHPKKGSDPKSSFNEFGGALQKKGG